MIVSATGPLEAAPQSLHALYVSLNSPVVTVDRLPVGPATAAIAFHGGTGTTLLVRSVRTGTVAYFHAEPRFGFEAALAHAESLGFLFDDEANLRAADSDRSDWPAWLAEIFAPAVELESQLEPAVELESQFEPAFWLSKFRWKLAAEMVSGCLSEHTGRP
jgi:hypothetical protein